MHDTSASTLVIRNIVVAGRRTSVRLEPTMWEALREIARRREMTLHSLVTEIDDQRTASSLTAAIRVSIVDFYRTAAAAMGPAWVEPEEALPPQRWIGSLPVEIRRAPPETRVVPLPGRRA